MPPARKSAGARKSAREGDANIQSVLKAVLVADAASYSRLMPEDPAGTIRSLNRHRDRMRRIAARHGGEVVAVPGDFLLALFATTGEALAAAIEFVEPMTSAAGQIALQFRIGLHVGDVFFQSGEYLGVAINIASRLQQSAPVGGIVMSQSFRDSLPGKVHHPLVDFGYLRLKNIEAPVRAFELRLGAAPPSRANRITEEVPANLTAAAAPLLEKHEHRPVIHVRPFRALGKAERALIFADGLTEELVTTLGVFAQVFRSIQAETPHEPGEGYEISGQVRNGDRLRITCQLVDRKHGQTLWSDRFDFDNVASYDAQERITVAVITALQIRLTEGDSVGLWSDHTTSLLAWEEFHRGRMLEARYTADSNRQARSHFEAALATDAKFVPAMVALGFCHLDAIRLGWSDAPQADLEAAFGMAGRALERAPHDAYATALLAYGERARGKFVRSIELMEEAVRLAPRNGELVAYLANMLWMQGDRAGAILQYQRALRLIPQPASWIYTNLGLVYLCDGRRPEARTLFDLVIADNPDFVRAHIGQAVAMVRDGEIAKAQDCYRELVLIDPGFQPERWIAQNQFLDPQEADRFMRDLAEAAR